MHYLIDRISIVLPISFGCHWEFWGIETIHLVTTFEAH